MATVPSQATAAVGDPLTATLWNDDVRDAIAFLVDPPKCALTTAAQATTNNVYALLSWDTEKYDNDAMHDLVTNPSRVTFKTAGIYLVSYNASWVANATGTRTVDVRLNAGGVQTNGTSVDFSRINAPAAGVSTTQGCFQARFAANDYIEFFIVQTSGGNLNTNPGSNVLRAEAVRIGT